MKTPRENAVAHAPRSMHESFRRDEDIKPASARSFGITFSIIFALFGILPLLRGRAVRWPVVAAAGILLAITFVAPHSLEPLNKLWFRFGLLAHKCVNPVVMAFVFFTTVTPIGVLMRLLGKDLLRLRFDRTAPTYWIERRPPGPTGDTMSRQF
jgi:hypothetical protein